MIRIFKTAEQANQAAVMMMAAQLVQKPDSVLGLSTGSTPIPIYQELIRLYQEGVISFREATTFNLDEYCGLSAEHECSYYRFMKETLFDHIDLPKESYHLPKGDAEDIAAEGRAYDALIEKAGGIDLQLLGIGRNAHIAFNEPAEAFVYGCHEVALSQDTLEANRRFFATEEAMPRTAITLGIGGIMAARQVLLLATGESKADAIFHSIRGEMTPSVPGSILRGHQNAVFLLDEASVAKL